MKELLADTAARAARYIAEIGERSIVPTAEDLRQLERLGGALPDEPSSPKQVLALLDEIGSPATVATTGGRYFGFVIGGSLPGALAANWLAGAWDQNAAMQVMAPEQPRSRKSSAHGLLTFSAFPRPAALDL